MSDKVDEGIIKSMVASVDRIGWTLVETGAQTSEGPGQGDDRWEGSHRSQYIHSNTLTYMYIQL
ncbi:hypothetical protein PAXRUDRAFT_264901 [Paxillus rubicundulus Ve08.2h10]|uniref:Uncharacterized protein n=1 Tax=Paxillus rubicundulus Ve08.2h10 TaxID=930991 RepID=A0A0D0CA59_9AGAM|nr:hypothetical protein PAXRUDRAFT_264901 [Paxillus rubicundulus Ve08.2h10]